ncbi:MAG: hypothetical protein KGJ23_03405 [Euryarchaeota archaeon]|nr:hypothetical protein [Euryarchaeota archaeon]MDE1835646.1 hypothetical protein [Euryarchaeota archaeon]MDE1878994.1 hypothetical protein [Euryarchaeota archaeon]MDE2043732.1 hypothetical protein [Thermoplasmata archaeon]
MADPLVWATLAAALVVTALSLGLLVIFLRTYRKVRAPFTAGLAAFAMIFLLQGAFLTYGCYVMLPALSGAVLWLFFGLSVLEAGGLGVQFLVAYR